MQHLGIIEQRTNEVLQMYAASGAAFQEAGGMTSNDDGIETEMVAMDASSSPTASQRRRLSLGVGPQQASGSHVVRVDPPGMNESDNNSSSFMMDQDRPMTRVELLRLVKENPTIPAHDPTTKIPTSNTTTTTRRKRKN